MKLDPKDIIEQARGKLDWKVATIGILVLWLGYSSCTPPPDTNREERRTSNVVEAAEAENENTPKYEANTEAIDRARQALNKAQLDLIGLLEFQQASLTLAMAKQYLAQAQVMQTSPEYAKCYQKTVLACLWSFVDNRLTELTQSAGSSTGSDSQDKTDESLLLNTDIQALLLAIALAAPEDSRLDVEKTWIDRRFRQAIDSAMNDTQVQNLTIHQQLSLSRTAALALDQTTADLGNLYKDCLDEQHRRTNEELCRRVGVE